MQGFFSLWNSFVRRQQQYGNLRLRIGTSDDYCLLLCLIDECVDTGLEMLVAVTFALAA